jgi:hypothetical protein
MIQQRLEQPLRDAVLGTAPFLGDEHLAESAAAAAEIDQPDRADDRALGLLRRDPESTVAAAEEGGDVLKIGLIVVGDREAELVALDREDELCDTGPVAGSVLADFDQPWRALNRGLVLLMT